MPRCTPAIVVSVQWTGVGTDLMAASDVFMNACRVQVELANSALGLRRTHDRGLCSPPRAVHKQSLGATLTAVDRSGEPGELVNAAQAAKISLGSH